MPGGVAAVSEACERSWTEGATGWAKIDPRDTRIVASSDADIVGRSFNDLGCDEVWGDDIEHVVRFQATTVVRRLWHWRVWESTFAANGTTVFASWRVLYMIPDDAGESMSRWLAAGRSALASLEGGAAAAPCAPVAIAARRSAPRPALKAV